MKELTIEEKAQRYEQALERAKYYHDRDNIQFLENIFPELKESEDEIIRKALIDGFTVMKESKNCGKTFSNHNIPVTDILAWLEKQGDKISAIEGFETEFERQVSHLIASAINREHEYNEGYVKWTANALLNYARHELEKQGEQKSINNQFTPEQASILDKHIDKFLEQKTAEWSEEDEHRVKDTIYFLDTAKKHYASTVELDACIDWLKSLRPQNTWNPSDEQLKALKEACDEHWEPDGLDPLYTLYKDLKKLREG